MTWIMDWSLCTVQAAGAKPGGFSQMVGGVLTLMKDMRKHYSANIFVVGCIIACARGLNASTDRHGGICGSLAEPRLLALEGSGLSMLYYRLREGGM